MMAQSNRTNLLNLSKVRICTSQLVKKVLIHNVFKTVKNFSSNAHI